MPSKAPCGCSFDKWGRIRHTSGCKARSRILKAAYNPQQTRFPLICPHDGSLLGVKTTSLTGDVVVYQCRKCGYQSALRREETD